MSDKDKVWPTGLTEGESEEIHRNLIQGTQIFGMIAAVAVGSFCVHLALTMNTTWVKDFLNGKKVVATASAEAPASKK